VPSWFAVTDRAFRLMLEVPVAPVAGPVTGHADGASPALGAAVAAVLCRADLSPSGKAAAIAALWDAAEVPTELRTAVEGAYARMIAETARERHGPDGSPRNAEPPVPEAADAAVRSSGWEEDRPDATWAGQFVTFLNIRGADAVLDHLKRAWAGLWTEGALLSRGSSTVPPGGGLIVQRMVAARVSGVLHTASVATAELRVMVANVGLGLGAGVVSGEVGVDEVRMVKGAMDSAAIDVRYEIGDKAEQVVPDPSRGGTITVPTVYHQRFRAALEYSEVLELARLGTRLETVMGQPLDIEFAFEGPALRVLQARPIPLFHHALTETLRRYPFKARP
jgi:rifampicin phosphotransferase